MMVAPVEHMVMSITGIDRMQKYWFEASKLDGKQRGNNSFSFNSVGFGAMASIRLVLDYR